MSQPHLNGFYEAHESRLINMPLKKSLNIKHLRQTAMREVPAHV